MLIAGIDPGSERTAWLVFDTRGHIVDHRIDPNELFLSLRGAHPIMQADVFVVERIVSAFVNPKKGGYVGREVFDAQWWAAVLWGKWISLHHAGVMRPQCLARKEIVTHLCGSAKAGDSDVHAALRDRVFQTGLDGKGRPSCKGTKKHPGPLFGLHDDEWSALAVALTWWDLHPTGIGE